MNHDAAETGRSGGVAWSAALWRLLGAGLFALGLIGAILPVLPTTIFWILALLALGKSDPALSARIRGWPVAGAVAAAYVDHGVVTRRSKLIAVAGMSFSGLLLWIAVSGVGLVLGLLGIAAGAAYVVTRRETPDPSSR